MRRASGKRTRSRAAGPSVGRVLLRRTTRFRRRLPRRRQRRCACPALLQQRGHGSASQEISIAVAPGAHAILLLDQAGWHVSTKLPVPSNITLLPLPPKSPELIPVENIWQFMRDNWLSNRIFKSYEDILDHCCFAWNKLIGMPWKIMSIGMRDWAHHNQRDSVLRPKPLPR